MLKAVLFDLDGTLLPLDQDAFVEGYFRLLAKKMAHHGYEPQELIRNVWAGTKAMMGNDGSCSNEEAFWRVFLGVYGEQGRRDIPLFEAFYANEFQQAKRGSGQGDALWERMPNDASWELFCRAVWTYQYTREHISFTSGMKDALYEEAQGIPFLAVHIYKLVQEDAILSGKESFSEIDLHRIASEKMGLTKPMREAMKAGKEVDLKQYIDIAPFSFSDYKDNYSIAAETKSPAVAPQKKATVQEAATVTLMGLGLSQEKARSLVCAAIAEDESGCMAASVIARKAYQMYLVEPAIKEPCANPLPGLCGYDSVKEAGLIDDGL